jgi:CheY-like chemotaxis protein
MPEQSIILAIDDDENNLALMTNYLKGKGHSILTVYGAKEGLSFLKTTQKKIKVIILDWMMPEISGIEFLRIIKRMENILHIPVILQTAKSSQGDIAQGMKEGAYQYLTKPFSREVFISMVSSAIKEFDRFNSMSKSIIALKDNQKYTIQIIEKQADLTKKVWLDLYTQQAINQFFINSLKCKEYKELTEQLLNTVKKFEFNSSDGGYLRCNIRLPNEKKEIDISDRGVSFKLDQLILKKSMESGETLHQGTYLAIPSESKKTAIMVRNAPTIKEEFHRAIHIISVLLEQFEERLIHFEYEQELVEKNNELNKKNEQIKKIIESCSAELRQVNTTYQDMKSQQIQILENIADNVIKSTSNLSSKQTESISNIIEEQVVKAMNLYKVN